MVFTRIAQSPKALTGLILVSSMVLLAIFAPWVAPYDPLALDPVASTRHPRRNTGWARIFSAATFSRA